MAIRVFLLAGLFFAAVSANFRETRELHLKKDDVEKVMVVRGASEHLLTFRWTLFHNGALVVHRSYDGFNAQNVLKLNHVNQSVRVDIDTSASSPKHFSYVVIKFKAFDFEKHEAVFDILLRDEAEKVRLDYLSPAAK